MAAAVDLGTAHRIGSAAVAAGLDLCSIATAVEAGLAACESALAAAAEPTYALVAAYDDLEMTPARIVKRLRALQMAGSGALAASLAGEAEYAALFQPVRGFRQGVRDALAGGAGTDSAVSGTLVAVVDSWP